MKHHKVEGPVIATGGGGAGWRKLRPKKSETRKSIKNIDQFFRLRFSSLTFPPSQAQDPRIRDIAS